VVDVAVHPSPRRPDDLRAFMPPAYRTTRSLPVPARYVFPAPLGEPPYGEWQAGSRVDGGEPAAEPDVVARHLDATGAEAAILLPLTRGLLADVGLGAVVAAATNTWLAETWLGEGSDPRLRGSIRIDPR